MSGMASSYKGSDEEIESLQQVDLSMAHMKEVGADWFRRPDTDIETGSLKMAP